MTIAIIPARMASTRFPGKPMAPIHGIPMIGHCYYRSKMSRFLDDVYIATCDEEIKQFAETINAPCVMTSPKHERASDRIAEAMLKLEKQYQTRHDIVVLIQGDEPMLQPEMVDKLIDALESDPTVQVSNGYAPICCIGEFLDPNEVKVVLDNNSDAIYFSREPVPSRKKWEGNIPMFRQVCIIPFRRDYLLQFNSTPQTPLEKIESIDMLRIIETGGKIRMVLMETETFSVDTPEDLQKVIQAMVNDKLISKYRN